VRSGGHTTGFIDDKRRANVAISRAKDFVIVVGNLTTIRENCTSNAWQNWFEYCNSLQPSGLIGTVASLTELWETPGDF
jgi:hypothetical protein